MTINMMNECTHVRTASVNDVPKMVRLHLEVFSGYFLSKLGSRFLSAYYKLAIEYDDSCCLIATDKDGELIGLAVGVINSRKFYQQMMWKWYIFMIPTIYGLLINPDLIARTLVNIKRVKNLSLNNKQTSIAMELTSIAVSTHNRGTGTVLMHNFKKETYKKEINKIKLYTDYDDNWNVIQFYKKHQFRITSVDIRLNRRMMSMECDL
ncbi:GNAT family N-acetyltransferase [Planktomarina temperata]|nr:GNAT family N-acetyltransferase [Planktomarina temperata]